MENAKTTDGIWDGLYRLFARVRGISKEWDWPELLSMVLEQVMDGVSESTPEDKLFNQEAYLMRLCLRYEHFKKAPFNVVSMDDKNKKFRISNYDYKTFLWAKKTYRNEIDNNFIYIPYNKLSKKQVEAFKKKAINNYEEEQ